MLLRIQRCIQKIKNAEMTDFSLKSSHVSCLYYLYKEKSLTAKELCDICGEDKSFLSHSLRYLEDSGYIYCNSDAKKRYNTPFFLTEKGRVTAEHIAKKVDEEMDDLWKEGKITMGVIEEWGEEHMRTPYK